MVLPERVPVYEMVVALWTAPKVIALPLTTPVIVPLATQGVLLTMIVPASCEPVCFHWMRTAPLSDVVLAFQVPLHVPSNGEVAAEVAAAGVAEGATVAGALVA